MAKTTGLIFSLFDFALAQLVPFGMPQYVQCILHGLTSDLLCVPFNFADSESVDLVVAHDVELPFITEIVRIFRSGHFHSRGAFQTVLDSYCCVTD